MRRPLLCQPQYPANNEVRLTVTLLVIQDSETGIDLLAILYTRGSQSSEDIRFQSDGIRLPLFRQLDYVGFRKYHRCVFGCWGMTYSSVSNFVYIILRDTLEKEVTDCAGPCRIWGNKNGSSRKQNKYTEYWLHNFISLQLYIHDLNSLLVSLQWRHNGRYGISHQQPYNCLFNRLFRRRSKKTSKLRVTGLFAGNSSVTVNSPHKWPVTRKMLPSDDVIMCLPV